VIGVEECLTATAENRVKDNGKDEGNGKRQWSTDYIDCTD